MQKNTQLLKGSLNTIVLKLLSGQEKMYGYEITRKVKEVTAGAINLTEGALYPCLHKMEADGLVTVSVESIENRQRKYYSLTSNGKKEVKFRIKELMSFFEQMQTVLDLKPAILKP